MGGTPNGIFRSVWINSSRDHLTSNQPYGCWSVSKWITFGLLVVLTTCWLPDWFHEGHLPRSTSMTWTSRPSCTNEFMAAQCMSDDHKPLGESCYPMCSTMDGCVVQGTIIYGWPTKPLVWNNLMDRYHLSMFFLAIMISTWDGSTDATIAKGILLTLPSQNSIWLCIKTLGELRGLEWHWDLILHPEPAPLLLIILKVGKWLDFGLKTAELCNGDPDPAH